MDDTTPISYRKFTLREARVLLWYFMEGRKTRDRYCQWGDMLRAMETRYKGMQAFDAADPLVTDPHQPMLLFPSKQPNANRHKLPDQVFRDPAPFFEAINRAFVEANEPPVPVPSIHETVGVPLARQDEQPAPPPAATLRIGDITQTPDGPAMIVAGPDGTPMLKPLAVARAAAPQRAPARSAAAKKKQAEPSSGAAVAEAPAKVVTKGHEV